MSVTSTISKTCDKAKGLPLIGGLLKARPKVAVIRLSGVIADQGMGRNSISFHRFEKAIELAFETYNLKAVALIINSPGGSPAQSALIGDHIRRLADKEEVPVYAFVEDAAASGGYWLACAADEIYANATSIVGSIGVISAGFGMKGLIEKYGVERRVHTSGKDKSFLDPFMEEKAADVKRLKGLQQDLHESFIAWVKERRGDALTGKDAELFEGQFWVAPKALELGLIDGLAEAKSFCREKFKEDCECEGELKFIEFTPEKKLVPSLLSTGARTSLVEDVVETLEAKAVWQRCGL